MNDEPIVFGGTVLLTKEEATGAWSLGDVLRAKEQNLVQAFRRQMIDEIHRRGWGCVEYAENTTEPVNG